MTFLGSSPLQRPLRGSEIPRSRKEDRKRAAASSDRIEPEKKVIKPMPGSDREPKPYFKDQRAMRIPAQNHTTLEN
jgi:hypothetical protein